MLRVHGGSGIIVRRSGDLISMLKPPPRFVLIRSPASPYLSSTPRRTHIPAGLLDRRFEHAAWETAWIFLF
ncbi:MAG: hypothetical protein LZF60_250145 [Nitrospira sp.]|nr:MAG: hypothetical protein LZF60_250145 [Nitrospira sp.]